MNQWLLQRTWLSAAMCLTLVNCDVMAKDIRISGLGARPCSEWQQWKEAQNGEARVMAIEWAHGFIAGHNVYSATLKDQSNAITADAKVITTLLDSHCQKHPESRILAGLMDIIQSLGGAKVNLTPKAPPKQSAPDAKKQEKIL